VLTHPRLPQIRTCGTTASGSSVERSLHNTCRTPVGPRGPCRDLLSFCSDGSGDPMFTPSSLQKMSQPIGRFPPMGSLGYVPHAQRYYQPTLTAQPPSRRTSLPSLGATLPSVLFAPVSRTTAHGPGRLLPRRPHRVTDKERLSPPRFLGDPCVHALLSDPGGVSPSGHYNAETVAFRCFEYVGSAGISFGALSHSLHAPCVRFAGGIAPAPRHTRFRWMANPCRLGTFTRWVAIRSF
jgi:hypothetical protein